MTNHPLDGHSDDIADLDVAEIARDDELLEALGSGLPVVANTQTDFELAELLADWRGQTHAPPIDAPITLEDVDVAITAQAVQQRASDRRVRRHLRLVAGAAAIIGVALGGLVVLSEGANPDDPLWGVKKVVFADRAVQTQATYSAQINLEQAERLLADGKPVEALALVRRARADLTPVSDRASRASMDEWITRLSASADAAIKANTPAVPPKKAQRKTPAPTQAPPVTDNMPQYTQPAPQWTPSPPQQAPQTRPSPRPQPRPDAKRPLPRPPVTILPN